MLDTDKFIALVEEDWKLWDVGSAAYKIKMKSPEHGKKKCEPFWSGKIV